MTTAVNHATILASESRVMPNEDKVKNWFFKSVFLIALAVFAIAGLAEKSVTNDKSTVEHKEAAQNRTTEPSSVKPEQQRVEPAGRFNPSEKLRADDAVSFPVDI